MRLKHFGKWPPSLHASVATRDTSLSAATTHGCVDPSTHPSPLHFFRAATMSCVLATWTPAWRILALLCKLRLRRVSTGAGRQGIGYMPLLNLYHWASWVPAYLGCPQRTLHRRWPRPPRRRQARPSPDRLLDGSISPPDGERRTQGPPRSEPGQAAHLWGPSLLDGTAVAPKHLVLLIFGHRTK